LIAVDTNILVYAHREDSPFHQAAKSCVRNLAENARSWAIPWPCVHEFYAITTHPRIYAPPSTRQQAIRQLNAWFSSRSLVMLSETTSYWATLEAQLVAGKVIGPQVHDARIAAICILHGVKEFWSADRDFSRYPLLKITNPLIQE
jgi:uncharacterized protein